MLSLAALMLVAAALNTNAAAPVIFWHSESHRGGSTVLALGGNLASAVIELCTVDAATGARGGCSNATRVVDSHAASVKFAVGGARPPSQAYVFRACAAGGGCSRWRALNVPALWFLQGDASASEAAAATSGPGGWLKVRAARPAGYLLLLLARLPLAPAASLPVPLPLPLPPPPLLLTPRSCAGVRALPGLRGLRFLHALHHRPPRPGGERECDGDPERRRRPRGRRAD